MRCGGEIKIKQVLGGREEQVRYLMWTIPNTASLTYFVRVLQMVVVHFLYGLEVNDSFHLGLVFVCSRTETELGSKPVLAPRDPIQLQSGIAAAAAPQQLEPRRTEVQTCVIRQRPAVLVKDKPALFPRLDLPSHLDQEPSAGFIGDGQMKAGVRVVSSCLDVAVEVEIVFSYRKVATQ